METNVFVEIDWERVFNLARILRRTTFMPSGCWECSAPMVRVNGKGKGSARAMMMYLGYEVEGATVRHTCDNGVEYGNCVNPEHLLIGTHQENMLDKNHFKLPQMIKMLRDAGYTVIKNS